MLGEADAIGVFQVESRAQMNLLPRMKPKSFYDLTIEIALIRPGPILGDMVHPFLRRREGLEEVTYPSDEVRHILEKTLGVPLFQEQAMRLAITAAGFDQGEADALRRALSHKRAEVLLVPWRDRFVEGCVRRGYSREYAEKSLRAVQGVQPLRLSRVALGVLRPHRLRLGLREVLPPGGLRRGAAQQPADGLLRPPHHRRGRQAARGRPSARSTCATPTGTPRWRTGRCASGCGR